MKLSTPDRYDIEARYLPALICSVPFVYFGLHYLRQTDVAFWNSTLALGAGSLTLTTALFLMSVHYSRALGKILEWLIFHHGIDFPSTTFLIDSDPNFSHEKRERIRNKIKSDFGVDIRASGAGRVRDKVLINEAVSHIKRSLYRKSSRHLEKNIQYGLVRNLLACSLIAMIMSLALTILSEVLGDQSGITVSVILTVIYSLGALISLLMLRFVANQYALTLYEEFLSNKHTTARS